ncbi:TonB-dependent receptor [Pararhodonellum marinum]|uniref:TonB-dependent receptor n=1 Tax=Pararhodonellum marinum TaxID=2755358 RepID=UPI00188E11B8|nr:TonB-dependent receptor [Pararhodonellum marinum]
MKNFYVTIILALIFTSRGFSQETIRGSVKDNLGLPVSGATVVIKGTNAYAISDGDGNFSLQVIKQPPLTLAISFVGLESKELKFDQIPAQPVEVSLKEEDLLVEVVITARRRQEEIQSVPIPISVVSGAKIEDAGAFNVNRLKELVPTVQLYSSNPRNTTLNIRGLGSTFGLTNDGIDPGVGFYVDGVYFARPAATTLDFIDIDQVEVLRGPQGTLFGKNTTAGAFNITTRRPQFTPGVAFENSYGNFGFIQAKGSITGPLNNKLAARLSFSGTQRDGVLTNVVTQRGENDLNNIGFRGQLLYLPSDKVEVLVAGDISQQRPTGFAQVVAGVVETRRAPFRQFNQIIADLDYTLPSNNAFDRLIDHDTPWRSDNDLGGLSVNVDAQVGQGTFTSTSAWRYWKWGPSNDRDFTGLQVLSLSQAPSRHDQWSQEFRYAGDFSSKLNGVVGVFILGQDLKSTPYHTEESGIHQWRFAQNNQNPLWQTPGLLEGYGIRTTNRLQSFSGAVFGQLDWAVTEKFRILPGLRYNYDTKKVNFDRETYGGLETDDPELIALKNSVYNNQAFDAEVDESNFSGQLTLAYQINEKINTFATYSASFKPVGINLGGLPREQGETMIELARVEPEYVTHYELGVKTNPNTRSTLNLVYHHTNINNFQTLVQTPDLGVNRGYLANAEQVRVQGVEVDLNYKLSRNFSISSALAYTEGIYVSFTNAPVPLEEVGGESFKDISGGRLPGISKWAGSFSAEYSKNANFLGKSGKTFLAIDSFFRSEFSSSPSPSQFLNIDGYGLANARLGFRTDAGFSVFIWGRNILNKDYYELLLPGAGNSGHYAGVLGDPRTIGITLRINFQSNP